MFRLCVQAVVVCLGCVSRLWLCVQAVCSDCGCVFRLWLCVQAVCSGCVFRLGLCVQAGVPLVTVPHPHSVLAVILSRAKERQVSGIHGQVTPATSKLISVTSALANLIYANIHFSSGW